MQNKEFETLVESELNSIRNLLTRKGNEYSPADDRLLCFKRAAELMKTTPEDALGGFLAKHIISIYDMLKDPYDYDIDRWDEKLHDCIAYCILLKALLTEYPEDGDIENEED